MEFRTLRYFLAVAHEGSITAAASVLNITQPTLSRQLMDLENELGHRLFTRGKHRISLTTEGIMLCKRAEEIIDMVGRTKAEFNIKQDAIDGDIYIGGGETQGIRLIAGIIRELHAEYPKIRYHLFSGNAEDVTERLDKGLLDFGVLIQPTDLSKYASLSLPVKDKWGLIMPKACELAKKKTIRKEDLLNLPLICSRQAMQKLPSQNEFLNWFGKDFDRLNIVATYNLLFNATLLVEQNIGYTLTLDKLADTMDNNVCFRPLFPTLESALNVVWKKYQTFSPAAQIFLKRLHEKFKSS